MDNPVKSQFCRIYDKKTALQFQKKFQENVERIGRISAEKPDPLAYHLELMRSDKSHFFLIQFGYEILKGVKERNKNATVFLLDVNCVFFP